jgi:PAS domain S-box-containing protein
MPTSLRLLLVEDCSADAELILYQLQQAGFQPEWRRLDDEASYIAALDPAFEVILADYHLPQFDALRALRLLQERGLDIPFIVITGSLSEEAAVECMREGATDYLLKDRLSRLGPAVLRALEQKRMRAEKRHAEEALRASEESLRLLLENATDLTARQTTDGIYLYASPASRRLLGYEPEELIGRSVYEFCHCDDRDTLVGAYAKTAEARQVCVAMYRARKRDGGYIWCEAGHQCVRGPGKYRPLEIQTTTRDVTERRQAEECIKASLKEKEVLLREIHHRVKNNLQVICSLLKLQSAYVKDKQALELFAESQNRVRSIAIVHEKLYGTKDLAHIDFGEYIRSLATHLFRSCGVKSDAISLQITAEHAQLNVETAIPCGLIVNELITNCLIHAFPDGKGTICICFRPCAPGQFQLTVQDTGIGLPPAASQSGGRQSLGWQLIEALADQLKANVAVSNEQGTRVQITFEELKYKERGWSNSGARDPNSSALAGMGN